MGGLPTDNPCRTKQPHKGTLESWASARFEGGSQEPAKLAQVKGPSKYQRELQGSKCVSQRPGGVDQQLGGSTYTTDREWYLPTYLLSLL